VAGVTARVVVALDVPAAARALELVRRLGPQCDFVKVGSELYTAAGPSVVQVLREVGCDVFLDLKFHDIAKTVHGAARSAAALGVRLLTVHATGGRAMLEAAVQGAGEGGECGVLAVTVLTSLDAARLSEVWGREVADVQAEVLRLAALAQAAGAHGVVCGGTEAAAVRGRYGESLRILVPGIRLAGGSTHDQARVVTPDEAIRAGASYLVLGRAVTEAPDPAAVLAEVRRAVSGAARHAASSP
jgi:orotidine-5'-phosphate decarboxylase